MIRLQARFERGRRQRNRAGWLAVREIGLVVACAMGVVWLQYASLETVASTQPCAKGLSENPVYRTSLDRAGERLWIRRPYHGITRCHLSTLRQEQRLAVPDSEVAALAHSGDGLTSLWCGPVGMMVFASDNHDSVITQVPLVDDFVVDAAVSEDGGTALCVTSGGQVCGWITEGGNHRKILYELAKGAPVISIQLGRISNQLCVVRLNGDITFHIPETGIESVNRLNVGGSCSVAYWSDDEQLIGVVVKNDVRAYATSTGETTFTSSINGGLAMRPVCLKISPDSRFIAVTTNLSAEIGLWNLETGAPAGCLRGHGGIVRSLEFAPGSDRLFSAGYDGSIREWSVTSRTQMREINEEGCSE